MRIVVTGATGNVGTSLVAAARRRPGRRRRRRGRPAPADVVPAEGGLGRGRRGGRRPRAHRRRCRRRGPPVVADPAGARPRVRCGPRTSSGTRRLADAVARTGVPALVAASSVGAYSPAAAGQVVDESWPTDGTPESTYSWQKALEERTLDVLAERRPACRVVRVRPALIFKRDSACHVRNLFVGHLVPLGLLPVEAVARAVAHLPLSFQVVHAHDVATAIHRCLLTEVRGAFNLAAPGVLGRAIAARPAARRGGQATRRCRLEGPAGAGRPRLAHARRVGAADVHRAGDVGARLGADAATPRRCCASCSVGCATTPRSRRRRSPSGASPPGRRPPRRSDPGQAGRGARHIAHSVGLPATASSSTTSNPWRS